MSNIRIQGNASGTGTITLQAPNTSTDRTINLPDVDGNLGLTSAGTSITVQDEGSTLSTAAETLNFVGSGVTASGTGTTKTITISGGGGGSGGGITMAESWRLSANYAQSVSAVQEYVTSNWEVSDSTGYGSIGTGLTESSGVFSFPSTGIYLIDFTGEITDTFGNWNYSEVTIWVTTDNSTYTAVNFQDSKGSRNWHFHHGMSTIIDVTDTSNVKFKFGLKMQYAQGTLLGDTDKTRTGFTIIRLGDT